jgi:hypothetical protein
MELFLGMTDKQFKMPKTRVERLKSQNEALIEKTQKY